jgi:hypothetical protein
VTSRSGSIERHLFSPDLVEVEATVAAWKSSPGHRVVATPCAPSWSLELADVERKSARLLRLVEDGHADPAVARPRLNELAALKRRGR